MFKSYNISTVSLMVLSQDRCISAHVMNHALKFLYDVNMQIFICILVRELLPDTAVQVSSFCTQNNG